jgi:hypothetical protein
MVRPPITFVDVHDRPLPMQLHLGKNLLGDSKRGLQDVLINVVDYASGRDFCAATSAARF